MNRRGFFIRNNSVFYSSSLALRMFWSTKIRPQYSQTMIFFREAISIWRCGGILLKQPPQASRCTVTTASPFLAFLRIRLNAESNRDSISPQFFPISLSGVLLRFWFLL